MVEDAGELESLVLDLDVMVFYSVRHQFFLWIGTDSTKNFDEIRTLELRNRLGFAFGLALPFEFHKKII